MSYPGSSLWGGSYPSEKVYSVYSTALADWAKGDKYLDPHHVIERAVEQENDGDNYCN